jgi:hypothetical protein
MKNRITLVFLIFYIGVSACTCDDLPPINQKLCEDYNVICYGKVDSVSTTNHQLYFSIIELYKGNVEAKIVINFDDSSSCMMSFEKNEEWIIYANFRKFNQLNTTLCAHSRKYFDTAANDFYQLNANRTFEEEKSFLKEILGIQPFAEPNITQQQQEQFSHQNIQPDPINKLWLLLVSLGTMAIIYFITRKKKNDDTKV